VFILKASYLSIHAPRGNWKKECWECSAVHLCAGGNVLIGLCNVGVAAFEATDMQLNAKRLRPNRRIESNILAQVQSRTSPVHSETMI
jgi:hypothetical protein